MAEERDAADRALDLLVYAPVGLALYVKDTAPSFLKLFVARGRSVLDEQRRSVEGQLGNARAVGEFATVKGPPQVRKLVGEGLTRARARAEEALDALGARAGPPPGPTTGGSVPAAPRAPAAPSRGPSSGGPAGLAIPDYDELSASQVVDRLEGLAPDDLAAIREYEATHRARNTVLGKIEQLTRTGV